MYLNFCFYVFGGWEGYGCGCCCFCGGGCCLYGGVCCLNGCDCCLCEGWICVFGLNMMLGVFCFFFV